MASAATVGLVDASAGFEEFDWNAQSGRAGQSYSEVHGRLELGPTKTYQRRTVGLPRFLCDLLAQHVATSGASDDPGAHVFTDTAGGPLRHSNFYRREFRPAVTAAGLPEALRFHDLRHTCVALLVAQGAHPLAIKERLGHSSIAITMDRYGHLFPSLDAALTEGLEDTFRSAESAFLGTVRGPQVVDLDQDRSKHVR